MKSLFTLTLLAFFSFSTLAQVTLVRSAPNDSFNLACPSCALTVTDVSLLKGQQALPVDLRKPLATNLLHWRSYDKILEKDVITAQEPAWRESRQLLDEVPDTELLSLHINLDWADSTGRAQRIFLVVSGLTKPDLAATPVESAFDEDPYVLRRFSAFVRIQSDSGRTEIYDCIMGFCRLDQLNTKTGAVAGVFEFTGNCIGFAKRGFFTAGKFQR